MTSKEYLEKALGPQKGFSDGIEQKNRIRRLLKSFFKERDCCTMIRPLTKEENLQNLEKLDFEELRAEFVEQVMQLRRKVINRIKPKTLNGKKLTGEMISGLLVSYVQSINTGIVPNIENAWSYICKSECMKAMEEALLKFEHHMKDQFYTKIPMFEQELNDLYREAKKIAEEYFTLKAVGEVVGNFKDDLKEKIKQKYQIIKNENEKESNIASQNFLTQSYATIDKKLRQQEFNSFNEYENDLKMFQAYYDENGPPGPQRRLILLEYS